MTARRGGGRKWICRAAAVAMCVGLALSAGACGRGAQEIGSSAAQTDYPISIGGTVISEKVKKAAVYSDSLASVVRALGSGYELRLAARGTNCTDRAIASLPEAGAPGAIDADKLAELGVDLVLTEQELTDAEKAALAQKKIPALTLPRAADRSTLTELYVQVGSAMSGGKTGYEEAQRRVNQLLMQLDDVQRVIPKGESTPVAGYIGADGQFATNATFTGRLLEYAGAHNLAADQSDFTADELATANPAMLFCAAGTKEQIAADPRFSGLDAVKNGKLVEIPAEEVEEQGSAMLTGVIRMAAALYPSLQSEGLLDRISGASSSGESSSDASSGQSYAAVDENSDREAILKLQDRLIELGYMDPPGDGIYGYWTRACVLEFQRRAELPQTGTADENTLQALYAENAPKGG